MSPTPGSQSGTAASEVEAAKVLGWWGVVVVVKSARAWHLGLPLCVLASPGWVQTGDKNRSKWGVGGRSPSTVIRVEASGPTLRSREEAIPNHNLQGFGLCSLVLWFRSLPKGTVKLMNFLKN